MTILPSWRLSRAAEDHPVHTHESATSGSPHLRPLKNVTHLDCYYCDYITDGGIAYLKHWTNLEYLNVHGTEVTSRVFEHLAKMKKLKRLRRRLQPRQR